MGREDGQAAVELVAALPALLLAGYIAFQLLAAGYTLTLADGAAEAGALALASGRPGQSAALSALPAWARDGARISIVGGRVTVHLQPPSLSPAIAERLEVSGAATARSR